MAVSVLQPFHSFPESSRKRTTSFSSPPNPKRLHRTESFLDLSFAVATPQPPTTNQVPYHRTLRFYKESREKRKALLRREPPRLDAPLPTPPTPHTTTFRVTRKKAVPAPPPPPPTPTRTLAPSPLVCRTARTALTPTPPMRAPFPSRSRAPTLAPTKPRPKQADLHRRAVTACMRASPSGAKILGMGARLAVSMMSAMSATLELEQLCSDDDDDASSDAESLLDEEMDMDVDLELELDDEDVDAVGEDDDGEDGEPLQMQMRRGHDQGRLISPACASDLPAPPTSPVQAPQPIVLSASWIVVGGESPKEKEKEDWEMVGVVEL
ncbi:hypothetical protein R3P38DRAFT_770634 [Favolaschia claudopus]|uniref:Uncharacterized protein n=1 Tax=Favolaschia claudopus TaxID=2862362 RepID=A0AAW0C220_9AGAR